MRGSTERVCSRAVKFTRSTERVCCGRGEASTVACVRQITATVEALGMATSSTGTSPLALLPLPSVASLSAPQVRGASCVWCSATFGSGPAVDLGPRVLKNLDARTQWFPRSCRACTATAALTALHGHAPMCEQCTEEAGLCDTGVALTRMIREYRR